MIYAGLLCTNSQIKKFFAGHTGMRKWEKWFAIARDVQVSDSAAEGAVLDPHKLQIQLISHKDIDSTKTRGSIFWWNDGPL